MLTLGAVLEREGGDRVGAHFVGGKIPALTHLLWRLLSESECLGKCGSKGSNSKVGSIILSAMSHTLAFQVLLRNLGMVV